MCTNFPGGSVIEGARAGISLGALKAKVSTKIGGRARRRLIPGVRGGPSRPAGCFDFGSALRGGRCLPISSGVMRAGGISGSG